MIKYKLGATIPTGQYANIQPEIELEVESLEEGESKAMSHIKSLFDKYSEQPLQAKETTKKKLNSFTEEVTVDFEPIEHVYSFKGKSLVSATTWLDRYKQKFDAEAISKNCEKSWGVPAHAIQNMWSSNGSVTALFGDVVHSALEHYHNNKSTGDTILENTDKEENPALPKHPIIRDIIVGFSELTDKEEGDVISEAFVTDVESGVCGQVDRLLITDRQKKTCRVQDYKVNVGAEVESNNLKLAKPYNDLPPTKLSKYQLQMSFYATILEKFGWTVQGLDAYVYEDEWKHYELDKIDIDYES